MRGIFFGLVYQVVVAIGFVWVAGVARDANSVLKANLMLCIAGVVGLFILLLFALVRSTEFSALSRSDMLHLAFASMLILVVGESVYLMGLSASNATTMASTALAFPAICLTLDVITRRIPLSSLTVRDYAGMLFLAIGFTLISSRSNA